MEIVRESIFQGKEQQIDVEFLAQLLPDLRIVAHQFKLPLRNTKDRCFYEFRIQEMQHSILLFN